MAKRNQDQCCVVIDSIGTATPVQVGAVAKGLGLSAEQTIKSVYRAPVILAEGLEEPVARQLAALLSQLGFESSISDQQIVRLPPNALFDVVVRIERPENTIAVAEELSTFCGTGVPEALQMLFTAPGLVLGGVSEASIDALTGRLAKLGARVIASRPHLARYDLLAAGLPQPLHMRLVRELEMDNSDAESIFVTDLAYADANRLWRTYGRTGKLIIIDRAFQHFEIVLEAIEPGGDDEARAALLHDRFGIPVAAYPRIATAGEVLIGENCGYERIESDILAMRKLGMTARADLATFVQRAVSLEELSEREIGQILGAFGVPVPAMVSGEPLITPALPLPMARAVHAIARKAGGKASFAEASHG